MRRTEKKLKSKGIKGCELTRRVSVGYDRNYVARYFKDVKHLPFSRTSSCDRDRRYDKRLSHYLNRWFMKQVGKSIDNVFHNFKRPKMLPFDVAQNSQHFRSFSIYFLKTIFQSIPHKFKLTCKVLWRRREWIISHSVTFRWIKEWTSVYFIAFHFVNAVVLLI